MVAAAKRMPQGAGAGPGTGATMDNHAAITTTIMITTRTAIIGEGVVATAWRGAEGGREEAATTAKRRSRAGTMDAVDAAGAGAGTRRRRILVCCRAKTNPAAVNSIIEVGIHRNRSNREEEEDLERTLEDFGST